MFEKVNVPKHLKYSPITQAIFEIRFNSDFTKEGIYSCFQDIVSKKLETRGIELPFNKIPDFVKDGDVYMRYQPCYRFQNNNFIVQYGPHSIIFCCIKPYDSWVKWSSQFTDILNLVQEQDIAEHLFVERIGLRYVDEIEGSVNQNCNLSYLVGKEKYEFVNAKTKFRAEIPVDDSIAIIKIENLSKTEDSYNSLIDIDFITNMQNKLFTNYMKEDFSKLINIHEISKKYFFGILNDSCIHKLGSE